MNILLVCSAGMSTSLLVTRMLDYAKEKQINVHIEAHPVGEVESYGQDADVILLEPQVRFQLSHIKSRFPEKPVEVIDMYMTGGESHYVRYMRATTKPLVRATSSVKRASPCRLAS